MRSKRSTTRGSFLHADYVIGGLLAAAVVLWPSSTRDSHIQAAGAPPATHQMTQQTVPAPEQSRVAAMLEQGKDWHGDDAPLRGYLLVGTDARHHEAARADAMLWVFVPRKGSTVGLVSIPRDTRLYVEGMGFTKVNAALAYGGTPLLRSTLERTFGLPVDRVTVAEFQGFRRIIDALGGVDVAIDKPMDYDDDTDNTHIHLKPGLRHLDGKRALDYARFRHDALADTGRMDRQRQLIRAMMAKSASIQNWTRLPGLWDVLTHSVSTDISVGEFARLVGRFLWSTESSDPEIHVFSLNGVNAVDARDGLWYFDLDEGEPTRLRHVLMDFSKGLSP